MKASDHDDWKDICEDILSDIMPYLAYPEEIIQVVRSSGSMDDLLIRTEKMLCSADISLRTDLRILLDCLQKKM